MAYGKIKADAVIWDNSGTDVEESMSNIAGKLNAAGGAMTGNLTLNAQNELRLADSDSSNFIAFKAPSTVGSNVTLTFPANDGDADDVLTSDGSGNLTWAPAVGGKILQVKQTVKNDTWSAGSSSNSTQSDITGLSVSITPSAATSKIFVQVSLMGSMSSSTCYTYWNIKRDGTVVDQGTANSSSPRVAHQNSLQGNYSAERVHIDYLDSPSTTSSVTYQAVGNAQNGCTAYVNRTGSDDGSQSGRGYSTITVFEVGA